MAELRHLSEKEFKEEVLKGKNLVLVDFFATWCGPCKMLGPVLEDVDDENTGVKIVKVDIDENMDIAQQFGIMSVPTLMVFKNGEEIAREIGFKPKEQVLELIREVKGEL